MNLPWKNGLWLLLLAPSLSGCTSQEGTNALRGVAASFVAARSFDRAQSGLRRGNNAQIEQAGAEMGRIATVNPELLRGMISGWTIQASLLYDQSLQTRGEPSYDLAESSNAQYRAALAATPPNATQVLDAPTLNALGYFLADKGSTRADFEQAAVLTRAAYEKWDISGKIPGFTVQSRATGPQDSYAWALYRLGKYQEARAQQVQVWKIARSTGKPSENGDIAFHLGEIYRALGEDKKARFAYLAALNSTISNPTRVLIIGGLKSLDLARV